LPAHNIGIKRTYNNLGCKEKKMDFIGIGLGVGLAIIGAGYGIARIGGSAVEGISRQPEAAGKIQTAMIIAAALIEGAALFGLVIAFQLIAKLG
jgi:F-type H+-transporting ATPase subunit c